MDLQAKAQGCCAIANMATGAETVHTELQSV